MSNDKTRFSTNERYELQLSNCNTIDKCVWRGYTTASGIAHTGYCITGTGAIEFSKTCTDQSAVYVYFECKNPLDLSSFVPNGIVSFYMYAVTAGEGMYGPYFRICGNDPDLDAVDFYEDGTNLADITTVGWKRYSIRLDKLVSSSDTHESSIEAVTTFGIGFIFANEAETIRGFIIDDIRISVPEYTISLEAQSSSSADSVAIKNGSLATEANVGAANGARTTASKVLLTQQVGADGTVPPTGSLNSNAVFVKLTDGTDDLDILGSTASTASKIIPTKIYDNVGNAITTFGGGLTPVVGGVVVSGSQTANASTSTSTLVVPVKIVDSAGNSQPAGNNSTAPIYTMDIGGGGGGGGGSMLYMSPTDFTASWSTSSGIVLTGMSYIPSIQQFVSVAVSKADGSYANYSRTTNVFQYTDLTTSGLLNVGGATFNSSDLGYAVMVYGPDKTYSAATNSARQTEINPLSLSVVEESLADTTNVASLTNYPSDDGFQMMGYKNLSLSGKIISVDSPTHLCVEATNDEDATASNRDWSFLYGLRADTNTTVSGIVVSGTENYFFDFEGLNAKYVRVRVTPFTATNTIIVKSRRTY